MRKGITPACAGKSLRPSGNIRDRRDHPRVCGEKRSLVFRLRCFSGSPPRVRGKVSLKGVTLTAPAGSPPRVRGKGAWICQNLERVGITPACAGKSIPDTIIQMFHWDHPRVCGEKVPIK